MTTHIGTIFFHHVTKVEAYPFPSAPGVALHVTHDSGKRVDKIDLHGGSFPDLLNTFPSSGKEPVIFSPLPSLHQATLHAVTPEKIQFEDFSICLFR